MEEQFEILDEAQIESLFESNNSEKEDASSEDSIEDTNENTDEDEKENSDSEDDLEIDNKITEEDTDIDSAPESVGNDEDNNEDGDEDAFSDDSGSSPKFFSSIAETIAEEGIFPDLDEDTIKKIKSAKDLKRVIEEQIDARFNEKEQRILKALDSDVEVPVIKKYEATLNFLDSVDNSTLKSEGEDNEMLRKRLLYADFLNKGFSEERAVKAVNRAFADGTDIEDSIEALADLKKYYVNAYNSTIEEAEEKAKNEKEIQLFKAHKIKENIEKDKIQMFKDADVSSSYKKKAFDAISKPVWKNPDTGEYLTEIQKYEVEHPSEFMANIGLLYTLTDGFKSLDGLIKRKVNKEVKKGFSKLEDKIANTRRDSKGNLKFTSGIGDSYSVLGKGVKLDI